MHLTSLCNQSVSVAGERFHFELGETICTEYSHKYTIQQFVSLAAPAKLRLRKYLDRPTTLVCRAVFHRGLNPMVPARTDHRGSISVAWSQRNGQSQFRKGS